jgi:hypothetical protein
LAVPRTVVRFLPGMLKKRVFDLVLQPLHHMSTNSIIVDHQWGLGILVLSNKVADPVWPAGVGVARERGVSEWIFWIGGCFGNIVFDRTVRRAAA